MIGFGEWVLILVLLGAGLTYSSGKAMGAREADGSGLVLVQGRLRSIRERSRYC